MIQLLLAMLLACLKFLAWPTAAGRHHKWALMLWPRVQVCQNICKADFIVCKEMNSVIEDALVCSPFAL